MLAAACIQHVARATLAPLDNSLLKALVPALIASSKEKNTGVKAAAESALMYVLRLREGESTLQVILLESVVLYFLPSVSIIPQKNIL